MTNTVVKEYQEQQTVPVSKQENKHRVKQSAKRRYENENFEEIGTIRAPNGGWGWIVTLSAFLVRMMIEGVAYSSGLFYIEMKHHFGATNSQTSWVFSIFNGTYHFIGKQVHFLYRKMDDRKSGKLVFLKKSEGPIVSVLITVFGWQRVTICGATLAALSFLACTWSPNVITMIMVYGLIGGIGMGLMYGPTVVSVGNYFTTKRSLAIGIAVSGSGVGGLVFGPLIEFLISLFNWQGTMWIIAAIFLNGIPLGFLMRPLKAEGHIQYYENRNERVIDDSMDISDHSGDGPCCNIKSVFDIELLRSPTFIVYGTSCFLCTLGIYIPLTYLPDYAEGNGHTSQEAAWLIATSGILNTISRTLVGWMADKPWTNVIFINFFVLVTGGLATIFVPHYHSLPVLFVYSAVFGVTLGVFVLMHGIIITELLGVEKLASSFGLVNAVYGISTIIGIPLAGALVDSMGNYVGAFYYAGSVIVLSGVICFPLRRISVWERARKTRHSCPLPM